MWANLVGNHVARISYTVTALVSLGCQSKCHQLQGLNKKHLCFTILKSGSQRSGYQRGSGSGKSPIPGLFAWKRKRKRKASSLLSHYKGTNPFVGFVKGFSSKETACQCRRRESVPGKGGFPGEGNGNPLQYSCLENPMDRGACVNYSPWGGQESGLSDWACISYYEATPFWPKTSQKPCLHTSSHCGLGIWDRNLARKYNIQSIKTILWVNCNDGLRALFKKKYKYSNYYIRP